MSDSITQSRLSSRLERYLGEYTAKSIKEENPLRAEWERTWHIADVARIENNLTPILVDDVRIILNKL